MSAPIRIELIAPNGRRDISVTGFRAESHVALDWAEPSLPASAPRRVAALPLKLTYEGTEPLILATKITNPTAFSMFAMFPILKDLIGVTVIKADESGDTIRTLTFTAPMLGLIKGDEARMDPGQVIYVNAKMAFADITGIPKGPYFIWIEIDPQSQYNGYASAFFYWQIDTFQVREID